MIYIGKLVFCLKLEYNMHQILSPWYYFLYNYFDDRHTDRSTIEYWFFNSGDLKKRTFNKNPVSKNCHKNITLSIAYAINKVKMNVKGCI